MSFQPSADSLSVFWGSGVVGWHPRQANDAVASERSIFSENQDYKSFFFRVTVNPYVPIFLGLDACGGTKLRTDRQTHTYTRDNYSNPHCAFTLRVN